MTTAKASSTHPSLDVSVTSCLRQKKAARSIRPAYHRKGRLSVTTGIVPQVTTNHRITLAQLKELDVCAPQRTLFEQTFGRYAELTEESAIRAADAGLAIHWFAKAVLTQLAAAEYQRVTQSAYAEYQRGRQLAYAEYQRVRQLADAEYERVRQPAAAEYERGRQLAAAEYQRACALTFLRIYVAQLEAAA